MNEKVFLASCKCGSHIIEVNAEFNEDDDIYISFYQIVEYSNFNFWQRVKFIWNVLRGNKNYIFDVQLSKEDANKLGDFLKEIK